MSVDHDDPRGSVTRILKAASEGDTHAVEDLLPLVYAELKRLAAARLGGERPGQTLQPTALVHEAYLRLLGPANQSWNGRGHFFAAAAEAMRRILIDRARRKLAEKHGGGSDPMPMEHEPAAGIAESRNILAVHEALQRFERIDPEKAALVKLRYFSGLSEGQAAEALGVSRATAARHWAFARAWLYEEITRRDGEPKKSPNSD